MCVRVCLGFWVSPPLSHSLCLVCLWLVCETSGAMLGVVSQAKEDPLATLQQFAGDLFVGVLAWLVVFLPLAFPAVLYASKASAQLLRRHPPTASSSSSTSSSTARSMASKLATPAPPTQAAAAASAGSSASATSARHRAASSSPVASSKFLP